MPSRAHNLNNAYGNRLQLTRTWKQARFLGYHWPTWQMNIKLGFKFVDYIKSRLVQVNSIPFLPSFLTVSSLSFIFSFLRLARFLSFLRTSGAFCLHSSLHLFSSCSSFPSSFLPLNSLEYSPFHSKSEARRPLALPLPLKQLLPLTRRETKLVRS